MTFKHIDRGGLWNNRHKKTETHPDYKGKMDIKCRHCGQDNHLEMSGWHKGEGDNPKAPDINIRVKDFQERSQSPSPKTPEPPSGEDIPF